MLLILSITLQNADVPVMPPAQVDAGRPKELSLNPRFIILLLRMFCAANHTVTILIKALDLEIFFSSSLSMPRMFDGASAKQDEKKKTDL